MKYLKVMFGTKSGASYFEYKLNEINVAKIWNPNELDISTKKHSYCAKNVKINKKMHKNQKKLCNRIIPCDPIIIDYF